MINLKNDKLNVLINEKGAEIKSVLFNGLQYMWEGKEEVWGKTAPILFPVCGGLKDDTYTYNGLKYNLPKHGFARQRIFNVENKCDNKVTFLLTSDKDTLKSYPFDFELRVTYELKEDKILINYNVKNLSFDKMYFSIGSHEAYYTPEGIEDFDIIFPQKETLFANLLSGNLLTDQLLPIIKDTNVLPLYEKYFTIDALVFKNVKFKSVMLRNRKTGRGVNVEFDSAPYFLLWHKPNSPFMCIEPWDGIADISGSDYDITKKEGIIALEKGKIYNANHKITLF